MSYQHKQQHTPSDADQYQNEVISPLMQQQVQQQAQPQSPNTQTIELPEREATVLNTGLLNDLLRKQLMPSVEVKNSQLTKSETETEEQDNIIGCAVKAIEELLHDQPFDREQVHNKLSALFYQQKAIYLQTDISEEHRKRQYITQCGLIMSPDNSITTQLDDVRVRAFIRAAHHSITKKIASSNKQVHVVYPACGPFAPLLMPLIAYYQKMAMFTPEQLTITLIDMQPGAIQTLQALIQAMEIVPFIEALHCADATQYQPKNKPVDIVILEDEEESSEPEPTNNQTPTNLR